jgi:hypothetical protein
MLAGIPVECPFCLGFAKTGSKEQLETIEKPYSGKGIEVRAVTTEGVWSEYSEAVLVAGHGIRKLTRDDVNLLEGMLRSLLQIGAQPAQIIEAIEAQVPNSERLVKFLKENAKDLIAFMALVVSLLSLLDNHFKDGGSIDAKKLVNQLMKAQKAITAPAAKPRKTRKLQSRKKRGRNPNKKKK